MKTLSLPVLAVKTAVYEAQAYGILLVGAYGRQRGATTRYVSNTNGHSVNARDTYLGTYLKYVVA